MSFKSVREKLDKNLVDTQYSYESKEDRAVSELEDKIKELEAHFKLKQDDWIEACKEIDKLEAKLAEAEKDQSWLLVEYKGTAQLKVDVGSLKNKLKVAVEALEKVEHLLPLPVDGDDENEPVVIIREALRKIGEGV